MRQFLKISLLLIYVFFNAGLSYSMHYCGEELKDINWMAPSTPCCPSGEEDCCQDVLYSEVQSTDQHSKQLSDFQFIKLHPGAIPVQFSAWMAQPPFIGQTESIYLFYQQYLSPPFPLYIKHQVFLI